MMKNRIRLGDDSGRGGIDDITEDYKYQIHGFAKHFNVEPRTVWILRHHVVGEDCVYSNDTLLSYVDDDLLNIIEDNSNG